MKIIKKEPKSTSIACKVTVSQNDKLKTLATKLQITKSDLMAQLIGDAYKNLTKNKAF